jgi:hypothetical protein
MKERPILFSAPMVRAILDGTKTQTRRVVKPQPAPNKAHDGGTVWVAGDGIHVPVGSVGHLSLREKQGLRCPYGQPGDRLWVREAWRAPSSCNHLPPRSISDSEGVRFIADEIFGADAGFGKARRGMFMPRWASRITLEVTGVRVERLLDISDSDAWGEGIDFEAYTAAGGCKDAPRVAFGDLWERINGPGSWEANPWVWVVQFKKVDR